MKDKIRFQLHLSSPVLSLAVQVAKEASAGGIDIFGISTSLLRNEGLNVIRLLRENLPEAYLFADLRIIEDDLIDIELVSKAGGSAISTLGIAPDDSLKKSIEVGHCYGLDVAVDLIGIEDPIPRSYQVKEWGADYIIIQWLGEEKTIPMIHQITEEVHIPVALSGRFDLEQGAQSLAAGASTLLLNTNYIELREIRENIKKVIETTKKFISEGEKISNIFEDLQKLSTPNLADAMGGAGIVSGVYPIQRDTKILGKAVTVKILPGEWTKVMDGLEVCQRGDVIVIDAGGQGPAVWGDITSEIAIQTGLAGAVIYGGVRYVDFIRHIAFPCYATLITPLSRMPQSVEQVNIGQVNVPVQIGNTLINPGDWVMGDDSGVVCVPYNKAHLVVSKANDLRKKESYIREDIRAGKKIRFWDTAKDSE